MNGTGRIVVKRLDTCTGGMHNVCPMKLPENIREFFRRQGSIGGKKRNAGLNREQRREIARRAAEARWSAVREQKPVKPKRKRSKRGAV